LGFLFLGGIGGMGVAYLKQSVEDKWMDIEEIKLTTGKHVFRSIPWLKTPDGETEQNIMNAAYTNIAFELIARAKSSGASIISFLSTWKCDAKSEITDFLAQKISKMGKKVLLIDLASKDSAGVDDAVKNLNTLKTQYDFIFVNAPHGFVLLPEIQPVKEMSEGIVVISSIETGRQELMRFLRNIGDSEAKILGIIVREENSELERTFRVLEQKALMDSEEQVAYNV
jgi:Mrp family chromosome partitioning ATPase